MFKKAYEIAQAIEIADKDTKDLAAAKGTRQLPVHRVQKINVKQYLGWHCIRGLLSACKECCGLEVLLLFCELALVHRWCRLRSLASFRMWPFLPQL